MVVYCFLGLTLGLALPIVRSRANSLAYYLAIVNTDGHAEVLAVPPGDDPNFIASHYNLLAIYPTRAQAEERCAKENNCAKTPPVK